MWTPALLPLSSAYSLAMGFRNFLYNRGLRKVRKLNARVISVGNITVGGTGKTPVTLALIEQLKRQKVSCGVVSRGYMRAGKGVLRVDTSTLAALNFGDEPALIKATHPDVPVFVGAKRVAAAEALLAEHKVDVIVCDDALQHRAIHRDLNLVLVDATEPIDSYRVLPAGRARESASGALARADFVILTKSNLVDAQEFQELTNWLSKRYQGPVVKAAYELNGFLSPDGLGMDSLSDSVYLVSGIAKPLAFVDTLGGCVKIVKHKSFPDHYRYTARDIEALLDEASQLGARWVLTTAKDATKLAGFPRLKSRLWIARLGLKLSGDVREFNEALDRLSR